MSPISPPGAPNPANPETEDKKRFTRGENEYGMEAKRRRQELDEQAHAVARVEGGLDADPWSTRPLGAATSGYEPCTLHATWSSIPESKYIV